MTEYASWVSETGKLTGTDPTYSLPNTATPATGNQFLRTIAAGFPAAAEVVLTISNSMGAETSLWSYTPGSPGTITRVQLFESTTGAVINWANQTATIECSLPAPIQTSAGAASAGKLPALGSTGLLDSSVIPAAAVNNLMAFGAYLMRGDSNASMNLGNGAEEVFNLGGWRNYVSFRWDGPSTITSCALNITSAGTGSILLSVMKVTGTSTLSTVGVITQNKNFDATVTGLQVLTAPTSFASFQMPPGDYVLQIAPTGSTPNMQGFGQRYSSRGGALGFTGGTYPLPVTLMLDTVSPTTLAATLSGSPNGGSSSSAYKPLILFGGS